MRVWLYWLYLLAILALIRAKAENLLVSQVECEIPQIVPTRLDMSTLKEFMCLHQCHARLMLKTHWSNLLKQNFKFPVVTFVMYKTISSIRTCQMSCPKYFVTNITNNNSKQCVTLCNINQVRIKF
ncbi:Hypothetical_protein [Hexamita inflata]|uniref:Hypothetical_protein n=1 Tax=Hexamita inflata TaxID=28002 RepID=A0AA86TDU9_9EUKA|nr:Hypothetical protein HINF_LOCUS2416 [Hexamita inflata]